MNQTQKDIYEAIKELEAAAMVEPRTTEKEFISQSEAGTFDYLRWLSQQAPVTASLIPAMRHLFYR